MRFIRAMLVVALMMPAIAFSQPYSNLSPVPLDTASTYGALASTGITGSANVQGDVGTVTGTISGTITPTGTSWGVGGTNNTDAQTALGTALTDALSPISNFTIPSSALGGLTLGRDVYVGEALDLASGQTLTLSGSATDVFIIRASSALTINTGSTVSLTGGAVWSNVFWYVGSSATINGSSSTFNGIVLAVTSITPNSGSTVTARLLANTGPVTINSDVALPVQATSFKAVANYGSVTLSWQTQSEIDNAGFNVLRQDAGTTSQQAGSSTFRLISSYASNNSLKGMGTSPTGRSYRFTDATVQSGTTYEYKIQGVSTNGTTKDLSTLSVTVGVPKAYALYQNYPNPFNPTTAISYQLSAVSQVTLKVYDVLGREVATLVKGPENAGVYTVNFNASRFASGVYFYRIDAIGNSAQSGSASGGDGQHFVSIKKLVLMK